MGLSLGNGVQEAYADLIILPEPISAIYRLTSSLGFLPTSISKKKASYDKDKRQLDQAVRGDNTADTATKRKPRTSQHLQSGGKGGRPRAPADEKCAPAHVQEKQFFLAKRPRMHLS